MKFAVCAVLICNFRNSRFHRLCGPFACLSIELSLYRDSSAREPGQLGSSRQQIWEYLLTLRQRYANYAMIAVRFRDRRGLVSGMYDKL